MCHREHWCICVLDFILSRVEERGKDYNENSQLTNLQAGWELEFTLPIKPAKLPAEYLV